MIIVGIDFGDARTGLAVCDKLEMMASEAGCVSADSYKKTLDAVAEAVKNLRAERIVVGNPKNMNGTEGPRSEKCRLFADRLKELVGVDVRMWDERSSTVTAIGFMNDVNKRGKKRKEVLDSAAAAVILESYLAWRKNHPGEI